jgi:hypothetical protein
MSATSGSYLAMLSSLKHILIVDITHAVNQAFCEDCQLEGNERQKQKPCKITQEKLAENPKGIFSGDGGKTCSICGHGIGSHPNRESCCDFTHTYQYRF